MPVSLPPSVAPAPPDALLPPVIVRPYDLPLEDWGTGHRGMDLRAQAGPVRSLSDGVVTFAGVVARVPVVSVRMADGRRVTYEPVLASVRAGMPVVRGMELGVLADSGGHCGSRRACLHVGLRDNVGYWDPTVLLTHRSPAVLKPG
jgi:murein DD-endopeptidase MepM/ murein hydrolase activator NlpD